MLTRNYWKCQAAENAGRGSEVRGSQSQKPSLITVSGSVASDRYNSGYNYQAVYDAPTNASSLNNTMRTVKTLDVSANIVNTSQSNVLYSGVIFGTGNTPETIDDYKLAGSVVQNISYSTSDNSTYAEDGSEGVVSYIYTITNNNAEAITIGEVGLFSEAAWGTGSSKYTHFFYMFERTALETPVTIPAGGVGQITYTIRMNYPVT